MYSLLPQDGPIREFQSPTLSRVSVIHVLAAITLLSIYPSYHIPIVVDDTTVYFSLRRFLMLGAGVLGILTIVRRRQFEVARSSRALLVLVVIMLASTWWSLYPANTLNRMFDLSFYMLLYLAITSVPEREINIEFLGRTLFLAGTLSLFVWFLASTTALYDTARLQNHIARRLSVLIPIGVGYIATSERTQIRLGLLGLVLAATVVTVTSGSRSGIIVLGVITPLLGLLLYASGSRRALMLCGMALPVSILVFIVLQIASSGAFLPSSIHEIPTSVRAINPDVIGFQRYRIYSLLYSLLQDHWFLGIGFAAFRPLMGDIYTHGFVMHGIYFRIWIGAGVIGLGAFLCACLIALREFTSAAMRFHSRGSQARSVRVLSICIAFVAYLVGGLFQPIIFEPIFTFLLAAAPLAIRAAHRA